MDVVLPEWRRAFDSAKPDAKAVQRIIQHGDRMVEIYGRRGNQDVLMFTTAGETLDAPLQVVMRFADRLKDMEVYGVCAYGVWTYRRGDRSLVIFTAALAEDRSYNITFLDAAGNDVTAEIVADYEADTSSSWAEGLSGFSAGLWDFIGSLKP